MVKKSLCAYCNRKAIARHKCIAESMAEILSSKLPDSMSDDMLDAYVRMFVYHVDLSRSSRLCNKCRYGT